MSGRNDAGGPQEAGPDGTHAQPDRQAADFSDRRRLRRRLIGTLLVLLALSAAAAVWLLLFPSKPAQPFDGLPKRYTYAEAKAPGLPKLHMLAVSPDDIVLRADKLPLKQIPAYGINGGFFYEESLLSLAVTDDKPANGKRDAYGSGWFNAKYARGTLVWDGAKRKFSVQVVSSADELKVSDRSDYFAQGGVSLNLANEDIWEDRSAREHLPFAGDKRMRSALVYNNAGQLWLVVTPASSTAADFRAALLAGVPGEGREGIFLDGDGSSQMNADEVLLPGDGRMVVQMIAVSAAE
ncbi:hypothetical protein [Saccharibacillus qingshengii]|uniref:hypothetical protein n=1 Tax=Saccharibacillus qingshengii TaxID=1763540 RepID=UPI001FE84454|nr:hypothetical protein [Saccharibacillus qingshengii]